MSQVATYRPPILGIDPGKTGGFCLVSPDGSKKQYWRAPTIGGKVTATGIAALYVEIKKLCRQPPICYIEKAQAMPHDGKTGMSTYFKNYGLLMMPALWQWRFVEVPPGTWCKKMHAGLDTKMHPKDRSRLYISQRWPMLYELGSEIWPERAKKPHEGIMDALMIAEYGRLIEYGP